MINSQLGPRQRRKEARPGEILEAAFEEFARKGFAATRVDDVALRAGITKGTVYLYFPSKEDLFVETFKEMVQPTLDHLSGVAADPQGPAIALLRTFFRKVYDGLVCDRRGRELLRLLLAEGGRFPHLAERWHADVIAPVHARLADLLRYGLARGEFRRVAEDEFPQLMMSPALAASTWGNLYAGNHALDLDVYFKSHLDMLERALAVSQSSDGRLGS